MLDSVTTLLLLLFAIAGYLGFLEVVIPLSPRGQSILLISIVVLFIYLSFIVMVALIYFSFGFDPVVLYSALLLFVLVSLVLIIRSCYHHRESMNWLPTILFGVYFVVVVYGTVLMRQGTVARSIVMEPFQRIKEALATRNLEKMNHDLMNVLMFVPFGILLPLMNRKVFNKVSFAFLFGLVTSTLIESIQLLFHLGQCDINDIIANTLGTVLGYLICLLFRIPEMYMAQKQGQ